MDEKLSKEEQDQSVAKKKVYTPPTVTRYGKLTELTAGGTGKNAEGSMVADLTRASRIISSPLPISPSLVTLLDRLCGFSKHEQIADALLG